MKRFRRRMVGALSAPLIRGVKMWLSRKDDLARERFATRVGDLLHRFGKRRRQVALDNLRASFPDWEDKRVDQVCRDCFRHFAIVAADFLASEGRTLDDIRKMCSIEGEETLIEAFEQGKGVIFVAAHFGNWEMGSAALALLGFPMTVIVRKANSQDVDDVVNGIRRSFGIEVVARGNSAKAIITALNANRGLGILADQNAEGAFLPLFGRPAGTNFGLGVIQERTQSPCIPGTCVRISPGNYAIRVFAPLVPVEGCEARGEGLMRAYHTWLESVVRENPEQWLWFHDRWRSAREVGL